MLIIKNAEAKITIKTIIKSEGSNWDPWGKPGVILIEVYKELLNLFNSKYRNAQTCKLYIYSTYVGMLA